MRLTDFLFSSMAAGSGLVVLLVAALIFRDSRKYQPALIAFSLGCIIAMSEVLAAPTDPNAPLYVGATFVVVAANSLRVLRG